jgi:hypothetical protein
MIIASIFIFAAIVFVVYDWFVSKRQNNTEKKADKSNGILQELFPGNVAAKLFETEWDGGATASGPQFGPKPNDTISSSKTIADLYPDATVLCK